MSVDIVIDQCPWCDGDIVQGNNVQDPDGLRWHHDCRRDFNAQRREEDLSAEERKRREIKERVRQQAQAKRGPGRPRKQPVEETQS